MFPPNRNPSSAGHASRRSHRMAHRRRIDTCISHPGIRDAVEDGGSNTVSRSRNYPYSMTLRLSSPMQSEVENLAYERHVSKAQFIRRALRAAIATAYEHGTQNTHVQTQRGAL